MPNSFSQKLRQAARERRKLSAIRGSFATVRRRQRENMGMHGPQAISLILLDNKRSEICQSDFKELLYCIGCGQCLVQCPAYQVYGTKFGYEHDLGGRGLFIPHFLRA